MTIRTVKEGGTDWVDGTVLDSADLNDTFDSKAGEGTGFASQTSVSAEDNSIFLDSADDLLKLKDNTGLVDNLGSVYKKFSMAEDTVETVFGETGAGIVTRKTYTFTPTSTDNFFNIIYLSAEGKNSAPAAQYYRIKITNNTSTTAYTTATLIEFSTTSYVEDSVTLYLPNESTYNFYKGVTYTIEIQSSGHGNWTAYINNVNLSLYGVDNVVEIVDSVKFS